ncbi:endoplasmic reticulum protein [Ephemerocybe angulata]|uniref:Endoplasmic reticulum protein n=1 Tax=Ephemerocybe angulata TaxID=980116 RepID=A0A8H6HXU2_9AGAR|nr:endoplasmic reticulum protein [Tulosesus angulatus]
MFRALLYAYVLGGLTFIPLLIGLVIFITIYTSVPVGDSDLAKKERKRLEGLSVEEKKEEEPVARQDDESGKLDLNDLPTTRKGWLTMRPTFEETEDNTSYVTLVRSFLDSRSKDPKRSRPKDMWFVVLKRNILYLYEDEAMTECGEVIELSRHEVVVYPEGLPDAELFAKRNAICVRRKPPSPANDLPTYSKDTVPSEDTEINVKRSTSSVSRKEKERQSQAEVAEKKGQAAKNDGFDSSTWFIFCRSNVEMEDWYLSLVHASTQPPQTGTLQPLQSVFDPKDMNHLVSTLDDQPDVIPMRWLNALLGRIFFSHYRTHNLEAYIIGRLMKKIEKVKRPQFLTSLEVTEVSVGTRPPMLSKPMLKELSKEGDASLEVHFQYKGEIRITVEATVVINLGTRFKSYTVKVALAVVLKELEGNLLIKVKRPPSNRIWYAFTQAPRLVMEVEPIVSDRQITWGMILSTIESKIKEVIHESVVMPNMDDIAYFDSLPFDHRGGIWSDAARRSKPEASMPVPPDMTDDAGSVASAPPPTTSTPVEVPTSHSEEALPTKSTSTPSSPETTPVPDVIVDDETSFDQARLKSWFSSIRSQDGKATSAPDILVPANDDSASESGRGRTEETGNDSDRRRSHSRRTSVHSIKSNKSQKSTKSTTVDEDTVPETKSLRRSLSRHFSREREDSFLAGLASSSSQHGRSNSSSAPLRKSSDGSQLARSPSPPSFFSTLKSKAGDKQALSNTAKETMRRWGMNVNWGLKKDGGAGSGSEDGADTSSSSRLNAGKDASQQDKQRTSFAAVRAAVAERKEREKMEGARSTSPLPTAETSTANTAGCSTAPLSGPSTTNAEDGSSTASVAARLAAPLLSSKKSAPSMSRVNTDVDAEVVVTPPVEAPIKAQPQAKVMAIPGISAKRRGEIQALGHVAEQPPAPAPAPSSMLATTLESKLKNPAMQTVYRFWRSPSISSNASSNPGGEPSSLDLQSATTPTAATLSSLQGSGVEDNGLETLASSLTPQADGRTPPPLPPRSSAVPIEGSLTPATNPDSETTSTTPPNTHSPSSSVSSPASTALKNIAFKDESTRSAIQSQEQPNIQPESSDRVDEPVAESTSEKQLRQVSPPPRTVEVGALNAPSRKVDGDTNTDTDETSSSSGNSLLPATSNVKSGDFASAFAPSTSPCGGSCELDESPTVNLVRDTLHLAICAYAIWHSGFMNARFVPCSSFSFFLLGFIASHLSHTYI